MVSFCVGAIVVLIAVLMMRIERSREVLRAG